MILKVVFTLAVLITCIIVYSIIKDKEHSLTAIIVTGVISAIIGNILIPSNISWYDIYLNIKGEIHSSTNKKEIQVNSEIQDQNHSENEENHVSNSESNNNTPEHIHIKYKTQKENVIAAQCNKDGSYDSVVYCQCGQEIKRKTVTTKALKHKYKEGICIRCKHKDPNYVKVYNSKEIMEILSKSIVSDCSSYAEYIGSDSISVFAEDKHNCFSIETAVSYNLWGHNVKTIKFNIKDLNKFNKLNLKIGGETKSNGSMTVEFFVDKSFEEKANKIHDFDASEEPKKISIDIKNAKSFGIRVTNHSNNINNIVFFGFSVA